MKIKMREIIFSLICLFSGLFVLNAQNISAAPLDNLPKNRDHIRIFRNMGVDEEIIRNQYDLSFNPGVKDYHPNHIALSYDLNTEMIVPSNKSNQLKEWWCINKLQKPINACNIPENWLCQDMSLCDVPEELFMHFKNDTEITLHLGVVDRYDGIQTGVIKGWDPDNFIDSDEDGFIDIDVDMDGNISESEWELRPNKNASAIYLQDARVPSFYWGKYWEYLTGQTVNHHACYAVNLGNPDYIEFMSEEYIPTVLYNDANADGIYFDDATHAYSKIWKNWGKENGFKEYPNKYAYLVDNRILMTAIKQNIPDDKIIIGNGWQQRPFIIDGNQREDWLAISYPYDSFKDLFSQASDDIKHGRISLLQYDPAFYEYSAPRLQSIPVSRERDQIYALASYYLIAGDTSYFGYGTGPYLDGVSLFFDAINVDVGHAKGGNYIFYEQRDNNLLTNGDFELADNDHIPSGWDLSFPDIVSIESESECGLDGKCIRLTTANISNYYNSQHVTLKPNTAYTLSGYLKSENITGEGLVVYGANFFPWDFDDANPLITGCGSYHNGTNNWEYTFCTFTTGEDVSGDINLRIKYGIGSAWFDNIVLREGKPRIALARKYSKALVIVRPRANEEAGYEDPITFKLRNTYRRLSAEGNLNAPSNSVILKSGDAAILMCTQWDGNQYTTGEDCQISAPSAPVLVSPSNGQSGLDTLVNFRWNQARYSDEDKVTHRLNICTNKDFTGCSPVIQSSQSNTNTLYAGIGSFSYFLIFGFTTPVFFVNRKNILLIFFCLIIAGGMLSSCGGSGSGGLISGIAVESPSTESDSIDEIGYIISERNITVTDLKPGTTYYWKVTANNGEGTTDSPTWIFTTL